MKYSVLHYQYFADDGYNLGDQIQSIAAANLLGRLGIPEGQIISHNRDELALIESEEADITIVQGWFGCKEGTAQLPVNSTLKPLFFSFHLNEGSWEYLSRSEVFIQAMKDAEPIGCRDYETRDYLRSLGVTAYYSGCLTLTFDRRKSSPSEGKVYIIDPLPGIDFFIPFEEERLIRLSQVGSFPTKSKPLVEADWKQLELLAKKRLQLLREDAALVVTKRLHVALPCLAMGIPTVFLFSDPGHPRVAMMADLLPIYSESHFTEIDWAPEVVDLTETKRQMELLFKYRLETIENEVGVQRSRLTKAQAAKARELLMDLCRETKVSAETDRFYRESFISGAFSSEQLDLYQSGVPLLLWGCGDAGKRIHDILRYFGFTVTAFGDRSLSEDEKSDYKGTAILSPEKIAQRYGGDKILIYIATLNAYPEVKKQLSASGFSVGSIIGSAKQILLFAHFVVPRSTPLYPPERVL